MRVPFRHAAHLLVRAAVGCALIHIAMLVWAGQALAEDLSVAIDQARLLRLERAGAEVIIGNPSIADVAVQSGTLLVVTGKTFGTTNLIVLDTQGREILNRNVKVRGDPKRSVSLYKGSGRQSYVCDPLCETTLIPGDAPDYFDNLAKAVLNKFGVAKSAVGASSPGGQ